MRRHDGHHRTDLERFMRRIDATTSSVAEDTGLAQATVWRVMAGKTVPTLETHRILFRWARDEAERLSLPSCEWLSDWTEEPSNGNAA